MEKIKVILDRERVSSEEIASRQDLNTVLKGASTKVPVWKSGWFYGTVGLASVAIVAITATWNQTAIETPSQVKVLTASLSDSNVTPQVIHVDAIQEKTVESTEETVLEEPVETEKSTVAEEQPTKKKVQKSEEPTQPKAVVESKPISHTSIAPKPVHSAAKVNGVVNKMPNIAGVFYGPIAIEKLCSENQISSSPDIEITSFKINYSTNDGDVVKSVTGNIIPPDICSQLKRWNLNSTVFITEIRGVSKHGEVLMLSSMSLIPTK